MALDELDADIVTVAELPMEGENRILTSVNPIGQTGAVGREQLPQNPSYDFRSRLTAPSIISYDGFRDGAEPMRPTGNTI